MKQLNEKLALDLNEGDAQLKEYLDPLMAQVGGNFEEIFAEPLKRAKDDATVSTVGTKLWTALNSSQWRFREAAAQAFLDYISNGLPLRYQGNTKNLFIAAMMIAKICCLDKLHQIYFLGLKILDLALKNPLCG